MPRPVGLETDGVVLRSDAPSICLTFDACGGRHGSGVDEDLITTLVNTGTPATLFLNSRWIEANPQTTRDLLANPLFELADHGTAHMPLSVTGRKACGIPGTGSVGEVYDEVMENQLVMTSLLGGPPRFFRSGTAHYDDVAVHVVVALGLVPVNFDINADAGATFTRPTGAVGHAAGVGRLHLHWPLQPTRLRHCSRGRGRNLFHEGAGGHVCETWRGAGPVERAMKRATGARNTG